MAAAFLSLTYGFPLMLAGLLLGFSMSFVAQDNRTHAGFDFASRTLLRIGIILLGATANPMYDNIIFENTGIGDALPEPGTAAFSVLGALLVRGLARRREEDLDYT